MKTVQIVAISLLIAGVAGFHIVEIYRHKKLLNEGWKVAYSGSRVAVAFLAAFDVIMLLCCIISLVLTIMGKDVPPTVWIYGFVGIMPANAMNCRIVYRRDDEFILYGKKYSFNDVSDIRKDPYSVPNCVQIFLEGKAEPLSYQISEKHEKEFLRALSCE